MNGGVFEEGGDPGVVRAVLDGHGHVDQIAGSEPLHDDQRGRGPQVVIEACKREREIYDYDPRGEMAAD